MKRFGFLFLAVTVFLIVTACIAKINAAETSGASGNSSVAVDENNSNNSVFSAENSSTVTVQPVKFPTIRSPKKASLFYDLTDDVIITDQRSDEYIAPASLLKLLTASTALKYMNSDEIITVGTELKLVPSGSSLCLISKGHKLKLYDLITGMLLSSGNDAAYTIAVSTARKVSGTELDDKKAVEYFADLMNKFARGIGMNNSYFVNPDGSDDERQFTTASDLLTLAKYALSVPEIREIAAIHQKYVVFVSGENITWTNTNKLLDPESEYYSPNAVGLKTGTADLAGYNLIAVFEKNGKTYIAVIAGAKNNKERYEAALKYFSNI